MKAIVLALLRRLRTYLAVRGAACPLEHGDGLHIGKNARLWAPQNIRIGRQVYIGKDVFIEANCDIGSYVLIANRVAFLGRNDHDYGQLGVPVRFSRWIGDPTASAEMRAPRIVVEDDVWLGYGAMLLTGVRIGRGAVVAVGSLVTKDVEPYSIVGGNPARVIGKRFDSAEEISRHEQSIAAGTFEFSERGVEHWTVRPGAP